MAKGNFGCSSPSYPHGIYSRTPGSLVEAVDSTKPCTYFVFPYVHAYNKVELTN